MPIKEIYRQPTRDQITILKYGGNGEAARFICGFLQADQQFAPLLQSLPAFLCVRAREGVLMLETWDESSY